MKTLVQKVDWKLCLYEVFIISLLYCDTWRQYCELLRSPCWEGEYKRFVVRRLCVLYCYLERCGDLDF